MKRIVKVREGGRGKYLNWASHNGATSCLTADTKQQENTRYLQDILADNYKEEVEKYKQKNRRIEE